MIPLCPPMTTGLVNLSGCSSNQPIIQKFAAINHNSATSTCRWFVIFWRSYFTACVSAASQPTFWLWNVYSLLDCFAMITLNLSTLNLYICVCYLPASHCISPHACAEIYLLLNTNIRFVKDWVLETTVDGNIYPHICIKVAGRVFLVTTYSIQSFDRTSDACCPLHATGRNPLFTKLAHTDTHTNMQQCNISSN